MSDYIVIDDVVPLTIEADNVIEGALKILRVIRPTWNEADVDCKLFTAGITNQLACCRWLPGDHEADVVLVRVYGANTDLLIDRRLEMLNMRVLNACGHAKRLFCHFENGIAYGFAAGVCVDERSVRDPHISRLIAREMARMHRVNAEQTMREYNIVGTSISTEPCLFPKLTKWLAMVPEKFADPVKNKRFQEEVCSHDELMAEMMSLKRACDPLSSPVVFCHNDLLLNNIVYNASEEKVTFIDYEYAAYNYAAYDIADHFTEYAGVDTVDYSLYPNRDYQLRWLRNYLEYSSLPLGDAAVSDCDVQRLYVQVNKFSLVANFFWAVWALIQAAHSTIDFDFLDYAIIRFNEYFAKKDEFNSLKMQD